MAGQQHIDTDDFIELASQRSQGYWLLSKLFLDLPDAAGLSELDGVLAGLERGESVLQAPISRLRRAIEGADVQAIAVELTRHLVAVTKESGAALPFESHFREQRLPGEASVAMQDLLSDAGYEEVAREAGPPDHLGAELRFMALLCHDEHAAWQGGDRDGAIASLRRQRRLFDEHLSVWIPDYCKTLVERSGNAYLKAIADLTAAAVEADRPTLDAIATQVDSL
jgi:putative dimethyl sulfoxide reductase chaperone